MKAQFLLILFSCICLWSVAEVIQLPAPNLAEGTTLAEAIQKRKTDRTFSNRELPPQILSNLLWAANGINRPESGKRTVPAAIAKYAIRLYVLTAKGAYLHDYQKNTLTLVNPKDLRAYAEGRGTMGPAAGAVILMVADMDTFQKGTPAGRPGIPRDKSTLWIGYESGSIGQDIYLYCASAGLHAVCCASLNEDALTTALDLNGSVKPIMDVIVGYPAE